jgi:hypothetical protein
MKRRDLAEIGNCWDIVPRWEGGQRCSRNWFGNVHLRWIWVTLAVVGLTAGCLTGQAPVITVSAGPPEAAFTVSMCRGWYYEGGVFWFEFWDRVPFSVPTVQILSGSQVVTTKTASRQPFGPWTIELKVDRKPLPAGEYGLRVVCADRQTDVLPLTVKPQTTHKPGGTVWLTVPDRFPSTVRAVQIRSGSQVVATKTAVPQTAAGRSDQYAIDLKVGGEPLPPGEYWLRVLGGRSTNDCAFTISE